MRNLFLPICVYPVTAFNVPIIPVVKQSPEHAIVGITYQISITEQQTPLRVSVLVLVNNASPKLKKTHITGLNIDSIYWHTKLVRVPIEARGFSASVTLVERIWSKRSFSL